MNKLASALTGLEGERVAPCDVSVSAVLQDLLAEVTVSQTYRNDERVNECIAVIYGRSRRHSTLGYSSPLRFLENWISRHADQQTKAA